MKKNLLITFLCFTYSTFSQVIDYDYLNIGLLEKQIIEEVNKRRKKMDKTTINYSAVIHENVSKNQTQTLVNMQKVYHPCSDKLYERVSIPLKLECLEKHNVVIEKVSSETEVCIMIPIKYPIYKKISTYQELSNLFVDSWQSSRAHRSILFGYGEQSKFLLGAVSIQFGYYNGYKSFYGSFQLLSPILN